MLKTVAAMVAMVVALALVLVGELAAAIEALPAVKRAPGL